MTEANQRAGKILALLHERVRLAPNHSRIFYLLFGLVWLSGSVWLVAEWLKDPDLGPVRTSLQSATMKMHGAAMLIYLAMLGTLAIHVRRGFALRANRRSGCIVIGINVLLTVTGWLLYYVADDTARQWSSVTHWAIGIAVLPLLCAHIFLGRAASRRVSEHAE
jgi:cytochrome bd-type quinol oxidase subunit 2